MGALFSSLKGSNSETTPIKLNINIKNPTPTPNEINLKEKAEAILGPSEQLLELLKSYRGCSEEIKQAISSPTDENHLKAWNALQAPINTSLQMYRYSKSIDSLISELLEYFCNSDNIESNLEANQYSSKQFIFALSSGFEFDEYKTKNSDIQNDFSFYRRTISKFKMMEKGIKETDVNISDEEANHISLFLAHHTPMFNTISQSIKNLIEKDPSMKQKCAKVFSFIVGICYHEICDPNSQNKTDLLRAMVTSTILYDNLRPEGMFTKGSTCDIKPIVRVIQTHGGSNSEHLMNGLRFNLIHLNDKVTPKYVKMLLGVN